MTSIPWTDQDLDQMRALGIDPVEADRQLALFRSPPKPFELDRPATVGDGVIVLSEVRTEEALKAHESARLQGRFSKFVPASGAATRMFQTPLKFLDQGPVIQKSKGATELSEWMEALPRLPFADELERSLARSGLDMKGLLQVGDNTPILRGLLNSEGLGYAQKPKGLIPFHRYPTGSRTPFEEHLIEAADYCPDSKGMSKVHFTVASENLEDFKHAFEAFLGSWKADLRFDVSFSVQRPSTSTLAVDEENRPYRDEKGSLVFRPAGHGALLENLNEVQGDLVYLKNIDNVSTDTETTVHWKKTLGGCLVLLQQKVFSLLERLSMAGSDDREVESIIDLVRGELFIDLGSSFERSPIAEKIWRLKTALERPVRVCGVVRNTGEPGGGPFWVRRSNRKLSLQIVESAQVDPHDGAQKAIFDRASHFNPVDLVCGLRDRKGKPYDLRRYSDPSAVFISRKSVNGRNIKALESPGLWNGSMFDWTTVFVEVPLETFNPVKTALDLLKPAHRG